jgi:hypothetical protein
MRIIRLLVCQQAIIAQTDGIGVTQFPYVHIIDGALDAPFCKAKIMGNSLGEIPFHISVYWQHRMV